MLYSTKRKLHNLLNGPQHAKLPGATTATNSSTAVPAVTETKKRRLADGDAGTMSPGQPSIRAVSPSASVRSALSTGSVLRSPSTRAQPAYAPWDRNAFLARLSTYRFVDKWTAKPAAVNEVAWSKRGWVCIDKNRVMCTVCHRELLVKVEGEDDATDEGRALVERYEVMAVEAHEDSCLWARRGCDDTIYRLPLANPSLAKPAFTERYLSLLKIRTEIPPGLSHPGLDLATLELPTECTDAGPLSEAAAILALFGWQNEEPGVPSLVSCSACFRRLGLWLFRSREGNSTEASVCRLDVIGEHREYCPWINIASQGKEPGWRALARVLKPASARARAATDMSSIHSAADTERTPAERDADEAGKLRKLKRLKTLYFGKSQRSSKESDRPKTAGI